MSIEGKILVFAGILFLIFILVFVLVFSSSQKTATSPTINKSLQEESGFEQEKKRAISLAKKIYEEKKKEGVDFSQGPCLSNLLITNWVADIAHFPRLDIDNLPENQCPAYLEGKAQHFVELSPKGDVIKAY